MRAHIERDEVECGTACTPDGCPGHEGRIIGLTVDGVTLYDQEHLEGSVPDDQDKMDSVVLEAADVINTAKDWNLSHRDELLASLVDGLIQLANRPPALLRVTFFDKLGDTVAIFYGADTALNVIVQDLYFDESWDWHDAIKAVVSTY